MLHNASMSIKKALSALIHGNAFHTLPEEDVLKVYIVTWNMNGTVPSGGLDSLLGDPESFESSRIHGCHLIAIGRLRDNPGTQECEKSIEQSMIFKSTKQWESILINRFKGFTLLRSEVLVAMQLSVFVKNEHFQHVKGYTALSPGVCSASLGTGGYGMGNKGSPA
jgi:hypothetical protein